MRGRMSARMCSVARPRFMFFGGKVFALGGLQKIDFVQRDALLLREAHRRACRRADRIVGHRLRRPGHFTHHIRLPHRQSSRPQRQPPRRAERLHRHAVHQDSLPSAVSPRPAFSSASARGSIPAGISSQPTSNSSSTRLSGAGFARPFSLRFLRRTHARTSAFAAPGEVCSRYAAAVRQATPRTRAISAARSVVEITPRASIKLNRCEHFRQWS